MSSPRPRRTFCRICEAHCGLTVTQRDDRHVEQILPDHQHPVSQGYVCVKGTSLGSLHHDPDRLNHPLKRVDGGWERVSWQDAMQDIGLRLRRLRRRHGPRSVALYTGNPTYFSFQNVLYSSAFLQALGSPNHFASHSVDANNKFHVATRMYGVSLVHPVPDLKHTRFFMCLGSNPAVSQMSIIHLPRAVQRLQDIVARGGQVIVVDPRRTETAERVGEHVSITPGTDAYLLMAMLHVIAHESPIDVDWLRPMATGLDAFIAAARVWTPERVAPITGLDADTIRRIACAFRDADGACLYMSTGVNMGPFGSLAYWLVQGLNLITGNVDRRGGLLVPSGPFDALTLAKLVGLGTEDAHRTLHGAWHRVAGAFPVGALAEEITLANPSRIRALIVSAGDPLHSVPGQALEEALEQLELLVSIDIYPNETSRLAHYILPATDMLERSDYPVSWAVLQETPHAQYTPAMVPPLGERRQEWEIFSELAWRAGAPWWGATLCNAPAHLNRWSQKLMGRPLLTPDHVLALLLRWGGQVTLNQLKRYPEGLPLPANKPGTFLGRRVPTSDGRVHMAPAELLEDLARFEATAKHFVQRDEGSLRLIGQRRRRSHNSWMHNAPRIAQRTPQRALIHPDDAKRRHIEEGDLIEIATAQGAAQIEAHLTDTIQPGVIAVPHGWGHRSEALSRAHSLGGVNINRVIPGGSSHMEPVSGQAIMMSHEVQVRRVATNKPRASKTHKTPRDPGSSAPSDA